MKKLMITAAALLTACVVGAAVQGGERVSGTDFESYTVGAFNPALDDEGDSDQGTYWSTTQAGESEVKEESEGGNKFLAIDETVPLYRNMYKSNENKQSATVDVEQSVYFSSQVKFTASEDASMTPNTGDKLIVWLRSVDGEGPTNLIVTAYNSAEEAAQDYVIDNKTISDDAFHTLTIVASADGGAVKFTVSVDGDVLSSGGVTEFQSLVRGGTGIDTITCAGFKGSGAIDDIEFGTIEENPTKYYEVDGDEYITFAAALEAAASADDPTITLINDAVLEYDGGAGAGFYNEDDLLIDLAGCTISCEGVVFANEGTLTILDTVGGGSVENTAENAENSIENYGGDVYISGGMYLGAVYNDDDSGSIVVTLNGDPAELVLDEDSHFWVIQASGEQPPEPTTYELTVTDNANATTSITINGESAETGAEIKDDDEIVITATPKSDYEYASAPDGWTLSEGAITKTITVDGEDVEVTIPAPTAVVIGSYTVTVTPTANATYAAAYKSDDSAITPENDVLTVTVGQTIVITATPAEDYEYAETPTGWTAGQAGEITIEVSAAAEIAIPAPTEKTQGGYPSYIDGIEDAEKKAAYEAKYDTWKATYGADTGSEYEEAFLLNCAPAEVATEEAAFKFTAIYQDSEGNWVAEMPEKNTKDNAYNGTVTIKRYSDVGCTVESATGNFFKATLD